MYYSIYYILFFSTYIFLLTWTTIYTSTGNITQYSDWYQQGTEKLIPLRDKRFSCGKDYVEMQRNSNTIKYELFLLDLNISNATYIWTVTGFSDWTSHKYTTVAWPGDRELSFSGPDKIGFIKIITQASTDAETSFLTNKRVKRKFCGIKLSRRCCPGGYEPVHQSVISYKSRALLQPLLRIAIYWSHSKDGVWLWHWVSSPRAQNVQCRSRLNTRQKDWQTWICFSNGWAHSVGVDGEIK